MSKNYSFHKDFSVSETGNYIINGKKTFGQEGSRPNCVRNQLSTDSLQAVSALLLPTTSEYCAMSSGTTSLMMSLCFVSFCTNSYLSPFSISNPSFSQCASALGWSCSASNVTKKPTSVFVSFSGTTKLIGFSTDTKLYKISVISHTEK